jgi:NAD(P)-dependent dehydrogenase (short-subunit alcohol dehydrogenase family)
MVTMQSLRQNYSALVIGASGGIGSAVVQALEADARCGMVMRLSRRDGTGFDIADEASIEREAARIASAADGLDLVFNATGALEIDGAGPERALRAIDPAAMRRQFEVNAIGPALLLKHFSRLLPRQRRCLFASLSARVGSIGDNRLGGWISYRAAKSAQNQIIRTAAIELARTHPRCVVAALHPGTVATPLSSHYRGQRVVFEPAEAAESLLTVLDGLAETQSGQFFAYDGLPIEW